PEDLRRSKGHDLTHVPHWTHFDGSNTETPFLINIAPSLQNSMHVPHPVQTPGVLIGWILPIIPISLSMGLVHPLGHAEIAMRILTGISFPKPRRSISFARVKES